MSRRVWLDVEDLFEYAAYNARPTGIQRVQIELCRALIEVEGRDTIGFLRHDPARRSFRTIDWPRVRSLFDKLQTAPTGAAGGQRQACEAVRDASPGRLRRWVMRQVYRLPPTIRQPLLNYAVQQRAAFRGLGGLASAIAGSAASRERPVRREDRDDGKAFSAVARSGDIVLVLGATWYHPDYLGLIRSARAAADIRFALLMHDIIPLRRPEWCKRDHVRRFRTWFGPVVETADQILSISRASARDIECYAAQHGFRLRRPVAVIQLGSGFASPGQRPLARVARPARLPAGPYALVVATLEVRKNHLLLFRVWRRLLETIPLDDVPTLVFAGRIGWMVADLMEQLHNSDFLAGKIVHIEDPTDGELEQLYAGCAFTLFPSFYEGWGLPVTESLAFGRPCIVSSATSLVEAGGALARYFDPDDATTAFETVRDILLNPAELDAWRASVKRSFHAVSWQDTAQALLRALPGTTAAAGVPVATDA